jgi:hypothetical protein
MLATLPGWALAIFFLALAALAAGATAGVLSLVRLTREEPTFVGAAMHFDTTEDEGPSPPGDPLRAYGRAELDWLREHAMPPAHMTDEGPLDRS